MGDEERVEVLRCVLGSGWVFGLLWQARRGMHGIRRLGLAWFGWVGGVGYPSVLLLSLVDKRLYRKESLSQVTVRYNQTQVWLAFNYMCLKKHIYKIYTPVCPTRHPPPPPKQVRGKSVLRIPRDRKKVV